LTMITELFLVGLISSVAATALCYGLLLATWNGVPATTEALALSFGGRRIYPSLSGAVLGAGLVFTTSLAVVSGIAPIVRSAVMKEVDALRHV
ncbi:MAG: hypothetical protein M1565_01945, partial [Actinobacteria bacterium]|nr:hypothetical protein [Actinomycetota bacterium]